MSSLSGYVCVCHIKFIAHDEADGLHDSRFIYNGVYW